MFEYAKIILQKVSFDKFLFAKEFNKFLNWLNNDESSLLINWANIKFRDRYSDVLDEVNNRKYLK